MQPMVTLRGAVGLWIGACVLSTPAYAVLCPPNSTPLGNLCVQQLTFPPCPPDSVKVGDTCVDKYEGSTWSIPANQTQLIQKVQRGTATLANLQAGGANFLCLWHS